MKLPLIFLLIILLFSLQGTSQPNQTRISIADKNWQHGGIFSGKTPQQELLSSRSAYTKKFDAGEGLIEIFFGGPFHYEDKTGNWQDINLNIKKAENEGYSFVNNENVFVSRYSEQTDNGVQIEYQGKVMNFGINTRLVSGNWSPVLTNNGVAESFENSVKYKNLYENIDLSYELTTSFIQHKLVFNHRSSLVSLPQGSDFVTIEEIIELPVNTKLHDDNGVIISGRKTSGNIKVMEGTEVLFTIMGSCIWDATFNGNILEQRHAAEQPGNFKNIETSVSYITNSKIKLSALIPVNWLLAPQRIYPVTFDPTVGVGNQGSFNSSYRYPFNTCRQQRVSQILFRKSDINAGGTTTTGTITDIAFFQNTAAPISNNNVQVKMQEVSWNVMTTPTLTSSGFTTVYGPSTQNFTSGSNVWRTMNLTSPFTFTNTNNLLIEARFSNSTSTSGCNCDNTTPGGHWGWYNSPYAGHRWAYSTGTAPPPSGNTCNYNNSPEGNPAYGYFIPATKITINTTGGCVPVTFSSHPSSQTVVAPAQAQFTVAVSGTTPTFQWEMSTNGGASWNNVPAGAPYSGITSNQLSINPTSAPLGNNRYRCRVTNSCTPSPVNSNTAVLTINAAGCNTVVTPASSPSIPAAGAGGSFNINVTPNTCSWSASETLTWMTITSPLSGTGDGTLNYTVAANTGGPRSGTISVNGQIHTINQLGAAAPTTYTISGRVIENGSVGIPNALISTTPALGSTITDAQGYYTLNVPLAYTGTVRATLAPYTFTPLTHPVSSSNFSNKDFDAMGVSINIQPSSSIYPWQREGDDIIATINVSMGTTTTDWRLKADVYDVNNVLTSVLFPPTTALTYTINTSLANPFQNQTFKNLCKNGSRVEYIAIYNPNPSITDTIKSTKIIEKKWDKKNIVYWRDPSSPDVIKIPIKWSSNPSDQVSYIKIKRFNATSYILPFSDIQGDIYSTERYENYPAHLIVGKYPVTLKNNSNSNQFSVDLTTGHCEIKGANSNIYSTELLPGDFKYEVYNNAGTMLENGYFDVTKIGRIKGAAISNKVIIIVGGILNEAEISADSLRVNNATSNNATLSYSLIEYLRDNIANYSTWYIGQGNSNSVKRNGYDVGLAIERIRRLNTISPGNPNSEIVIVCHSKGGLDVRSLLSTQSNSTYLNSSFDGRPFSFKDSVISSVIKKVVFLGSPHLGSPIENLLSFLSFDLADSPGGLDLRVNSNIVANLSAPSMSLPGTIKYCNVTGFSLYPLFGFGDLVVPELSSLFLPTLPNTKLQLRQLGFPPGSIQHFSIHKSKILDYDPVLSSQAATFMCYTGINNLNKIKNFVQTGDISQTCSSPVSITSTQGVLFYKSKLSNAKVYLKKPTEVISLGITDSDGGLYYDTYLPVTVGDSLLLKASGADSIIFPFKELTHDNHYINRIVTFKSPIDADKVLYPTFRLLNETPICQNKMIQIGVTGQNVNKVLINVQSSSSSFVPLSLSNGTATISLDTGYNKLLVKLIGLDTVILEKEVYYIPPPYLNQFARTLIIQSPTDYAGANMYVNNKYYKTINGGMNQFMIFMENNEIRFSRFGYNDSTYFVDNNTNINLTLRIKSYSSLTDSTIFNFNNRPNPQYWKTITVKNLSPFSNVQLAAKQYDDAFTGMSLRPQTRKFVFRRVGSADAAFYKTAIALDQIITPDKDSVYLLSVKGNRYIKYLPNVTGVTEYDPEVQKVEFDKLDFTSNSTHEIVLMQKQPPVMKPMDTIWHSGQTLVFPIDMFVSDPDSIKNDITASSNDVKVTVNGNLVYVTAPVNFVGTTSFTLTGTHDWLDKTKTYIMKVIPPEVFVPTGFTPNNDGRNDILKPVFMGKLLYCHFSVFNRYGQKVFETRDCLAGWNGRINGVEQSTNSFVYYLTYRFEGTNETEKKAKGTFTLIK